ncbi:MAG: GNAT family N-acetyltransferase [Ardenticatenales bacterium]|nr:GNAT family N-acetyltransferase [Ardenticatenales bacterium]
MSQSRGLVLVRPTLALQIEYRKMVEEFIAVGEGYPWNNVDLAREDFAAFVRELAEEAEGINLPPGVPAQQTYCGVLEDGTVVGEIRFRPSLSPPYEPHKGHIGYNIRPSAQGKGYATRQLALLLDEARRLGLPGVLLTIEGNNPASVRVIEKNEGCFSHQVVDERGDVVSCYWIDLDKVDDSGEQ